MAAAGDLVRRAGRPRLRRKKGAIERLYTDPPEGASSSASTRWGRQSAKSFPGQRAVRAEPGVEPDGTPPARRAGQAGGRLRPAAARGYVFGAFRPATGEALTAPYPSRGRGQLGRLPGAGRGVGPGGGRAGLRDRSTTCRRHRATDVLLFCAGAPAVGVRLPAEVRGVPEPDRAVVEGAASRWR